jgi:erythromycin esterase
MPNGISRRRLLRAAGACGVGLFAGASWGQSPDEDALQRWIEHYAVRLNDDAKLDWNPRDAERLASAIADARIVMRGEPSHGAGGAFAAKVRLVKLLHERLGFDVLVWESGLIDLERTEAALRGGVDPVEAAQRGILKIWSASTECKPLFAYAAKSDKGAHPLTMAGFDMQLTADGALDCFTAELREFVSTLPSASRGHVKALAEDVLTYFGRLYRYTDALAKKIAAFGHAGMSGPAMGNAIQAWNKSEGDALRPAPEDLKGLEESVDALNSLLQGESERGETAGRIGFMVRAITGLAGYGANILEEQGSQTAKAGTGGSAATHENRRDRINAENLKWLIENTYRGRKIIVWAHSAHVMNAWYGPSFDSVSLTPLDDGMKPTGAWLADWYGEAVYRIGITTYQGSDGWVGTPPSPVPPAASGSLEERLHRLGAPEAFLPLAKVTLPVTSVAMRIPKYKTETITNPAQAFNALFFIDAMTPATLV